VTWQEFTSRTAAYQREFYKNEEKMAFLRNLPMCADFLAPGNKSMIRPLIYLLTMLALAGFWAMVLLFNYVDYTEGSPIFLKPQFQQLFEANRLLLLGAELLFPLMMCATFLALALVKLRPRSIRLAALLAVFMAMEFWMMRAFFFPDRLLRYYQQSDPEYYQHVSEGDPFVIYFVGHVAVMAFLLAVKEYTPTLATRPADFDPDTP
jgi:hypothetical protein